MNLIRKPSSLVILTGLGILSGRYSFTAAKNDWFYEFYGYYAESFIEPLEVVAVTLLIVGIWLAFFSVEVQKKWWRIARWFLVFVILALGYSVTTPYQGGGYIGFPGVRELMFLWGIVFVCYTLIATVANRL